jgi:hypothetical protein
MLAAGAIAACRWAEGRAARFRTLVGGLAVTGSALAAISLPALPLRSVDAAARTLFGWAVPPMALTHDLHAMYGWQTHAATIDRVFATLPPTERPRTTILAGSYSQASAVNVLGAPTTPRAVSGHMNYHLWGPDGDRGAVLIAFGVPRSLLERHYRSCTQTARIQAPLARPGDSDLPVLVCRDPTTTMPDLWAEVRRFRHAPLRPD